MSRYYKIRKRARAVVVSACLTPALLLPAAAARTGDRIPTGGPWVVSLGDSYISGEAGRWAGNTDYGSWYIDALGPTAYYDNATDTAEVIRRCHRSHSAEIHIGGGVQSLNLACSGARTSTFTDSSGFFKPGLDFYNSRGQQGQALMLRNFAADHRVTMVAVSIGGNDFGFGDIVSKCVKYFLTTPSWDPSYCKNASSVTDHFTPANIAAVTSHIAQALRNVRTAMYQIGYADSAYKILVQNYPSPIPDSSGFRYPEKGFTRQSTGGCGFWNADANWATGTALPKISAAVDNAVSESGLTNIVRMNIESAFNGRKLCENTVGLLEEERLDRWTDPNAVNRTEWIDQIRTTTTIDSDYYVQESLHPNYWGQLALRNCVRQAYDNGAPHGGTCTIAGNGLNAQHEPVMSLH